MSVPTQFPSITLAARSGAAEMTGLTPGQTLSVRVLGPATGGGTLVQSATQQLALQLPTPPAAGTILHLRVEGRGPDQRLVLLQASPPFSQAAPSPSQSSAALPQFVPPGFSSGGGAANGSVAPQPGTDPARHALAQMVQAALGRQGNVVPLLETIAALGVSATSLPEPVRRLLERIAGMPLRLGEASVGGRSLQQAALGSGLFQESALSGGRVLPPGSDLKGQLLELSQVLRSWLGPEVAAVAPIRPPPPPLRGALPRAPSRSSPGASLSGTPKQAGQRLLDQAEAALSRVRLMQNASLPDETVRMTGSAEWNFDLPFVFNGHFGAMPMQIRRDDSSGGAPGERSWKVRFAVDLGENGEIGAQIALRANQASVMLWATQPGLATAMEGALPQLAEMLSQAGLSPGTLVCRPGPPEGPSRPSGGMLDAVS